MARRLRDAAVRDNATWCDIVCVTNDLDTFWGPSAWSTPRRPPDGYPDAITLTRGVDPAELLGRIDAGPGSSVKDSFADLDLVPHGFDVLFDASWIARRPRLDDSRPPAPEAEWEVVQDEPALRRWSAAHGMIGAFRPALLDCADVRVIGRRVDNEFVAGAVVLGHRDVVGLSNVFCRNGNAATSYADAASTAGACFPDRPLVGYENGEDLEHALVAGFQAIGPLRVWRKA